MSLSKLREKQAELYSQATEKNTQATSEEVSAEDATILFEECDRLIEEAQGMDEAIEQAQKREDTLNKYAGDGKAKKEANVPAEGQEGPRIKLPASAKRHFVQNFKGDKEGMSPEERAFGFGRCLLAIAARTNSDMFGHFAPLIRSHEDTFGKLYRTSERGVMGAASEGGNAGIWVPTEFGTDLISLMLRYGVVRQLFNVMPMSSDKRTDPKEGSDPTPVFVGEGVEGTDVTPTDDRTITLTARKLMAILLWSSELNEDSIAEFGDSMLRRMANGFAKKEDDCGFIGDGTSTYGQMKGVNTVLQDVDGAGTNSAGLVTGTGNAWSELTLADHEKVTALLPDFAEDADDGAVWVTHKKYYFEVMQKLILASGGVPGMEIREGVRRPIFLGWPVVFSNSYPKTEANSQVVASLGNFRRGASFGDRRAYSVTFSTEATIGSVNLFSSDQIAVKATERFDIAVHSVGDATDAGPIVGLETKAS